MLGRRTMLGRLLQSEFPSPPGGKGKNGTVAIETASRPYEGKERSTTWSSNLLWGIHPKELKSVCQSLCTVTNLIVTLLATAQNQKETAE